MIYHIHVNNNYKNKTKHHPKLITDILHTLFTNNVLTTTIKIHDLFNLRQICKQKL